MAEGSEKSLDEMTVAELRERASEHEITGRSSMNKDELRQAVEDADEQTAMMKSDDASSSRSSDESESESSSDSDAQDRPWRQSSSSSASGEGKTDTSNITAPSIGPNTVIELRPPQDRLDMENISKVDAMGLDKRRQVGGKRYGASPAKQAAVYGGALAVIAGLFIGGKLLTDELDKAPAEQEKFAPWAEAEQKAPPKAGIDFPRSTEQ